MGHPVEFIAFIALALEGASRPSSKLIVNMFSLCTSYNKTKIIRGFSQKNSWIFKIFKNLMKIEFWWRHIFEILIIHKPSLWSREVPQKIWARSVQPFIGYKQTDRQAKFIYRLHPPYDTFDLPARGFSARLA